MKAFSNWLYRISTNRNTLITLVIFVLFAALALPRMLDTPWIKAAGLPDTTLVYSAHDLYTMAEAYGESGRAAFTPWHFTWDLAFPIVYTALLLIAGSWLIRPVSATASRWRFVNTLPLIGFLLDLLENGAASFVITHYPARTPMAAIVPIITLVKWSSIGITIVILLALGVSGIKQRKAHPLAR